MISRDITYNTIETLKENTSISENVDPKSLLPYLQSAELMHIIPIIGEALDTELKKHITGNTLTGDNHTLVYEYIIPASAYASWLDSSTFMHIKTTNKGLVHQFSDNSNNIDYESFSHYRQSIRDKLTFFERRLKEYLDKNKSKYPKYRPDNDECDDKDNGEWSTGIFLY